VTNEVSELASQPVGCYSTQSCHPNDTRKKDSRVQQLQCRLSHLLLPDLPLMPHRWLVALGGLNKPSMSPPNARLCKSWQHPVHEAAFELRKRTTSTQLSQSSKDVCSKLSRTGRKLSDRASADVASKQAAGLRLPLGSTDAPSCRLVRSDDVQALAASTAVLRSRVPARAAAGRQSEAGRQQQLPHEQEQEGSQEAGGGQQLLEQEQGSGDEQQLQDASQQEGREGDEGGGAEDSDAETETEEGELPASQQEQPALGKRSMSPRMGVPSAKRQHTEGGTGVERVAMPAVENTMRADTPH